ncbi:hypothetical protein BCD67_13735 [Oscillatoriales cyanobacterium USR001]|nr:hypothetical protein BCD67_13735 [Oscillatoriales cyanobacterium USR001]
MLTAVLMINLLISLICFYMARQVWQVKRTLDRVEKTAIAMERRTHKVLSQAPSSIAKGEKRTRKLRQQYQKLESQAQKLQQIFSFLTLGQTLWRRRSPRFK